MKRSGRLSNEEWTAVKPDLRDVHLYGGGFILPIGIVCVLYGYAGNLLVAIGSAISVLGLYLILLARPWR
jgi:hypothetical protein